MTKLTARDNYVFALVDSSAVYDNVIYLSDIDSPDRYIEITSDDANKLKEKLVTIHIPD